MKASLTNYRQAPRKVRLVADAIRGKSVSQAQHTLRFLGKRASPAVGKLLDSAIANAREGGANVDELVVKSIAVNKGAMQKRYRPFARGRAGVIRKTFSHVTIELAAMPAKENPKKKSSTKKIAKKSGNKQPATSN